MSQSALSLWYLDKYIEEEKEILKENKERTFEDDNLKVKICNERGIYIHYLQLMNFKRALLYGSAGSGKTYVLNRLFKNILCKLSRYCMYFDLKEYRGEELLDLICSRIKCRNMTREIIKQLLVDGEILIIFDNYDEMDFIDKEKLNRKVFNNEKLKKLRFIVASQEKVNNVKFTETYHIESFGTRDVYKKVIRKHFNNPNDFKKFKKYLRKNKLECFLYRPINLKYILDILSYKKNISFIYKLKSENDLYEMYINTIIEDKLLVKTISYIAYYMMKGSIKSISRHDLRILTAEALRDCARGYDIEKAVTIIESRIFEESRHRKDEYRFIDTNIMMHLAHEYIVINKIKWKNIINNRSFYKYFLWLCRIDAKFTYNNICRLDDEFLYNMLCDVEDKKIDIFYPYIKLFFSGNLYDDLIRKLNLIYQRFRWEENVQEMTINFLKDLSLKEKNIEKLMKNRIVYHICENENINNGYKILEDRWISEGRNNEFIKKVYMNIVKADYVEEWKIYKKFQKIAMQ